MKATFALLANIEVYNWVRKLAWEIHQTYRTGTLHVRLPPHISLKQPFAITDLAPLEAYMAELAATISPFTVKLTELQLEIGNFNAMEFGILWLDVQETVALRQLHEGIANLLQDVAIGDVVPVFGDLAVLDPMDIDMRPGHFFVGRGHAHHLAVLCPSEGDDTGDNVLFDDPAVNRDVEIGDAGEEDHDIRKRRA